MPCCYWCSTRYFTSVLLCVRVCISAWFHPFCSNVYDAVDAWFLLSTLMMLLQPMLSQLLDAVIAILKTLWLHQLHAYITMTFHPLLSEKGITACCIVCSLFLCFLYVCVPWVNKGVDCRLQNVTRKNYTIVILTNYSEMYWKYLKLP